MCSAHDTAGCFFAKQRREDKILAFHFAKYALAKVFYAVTSADFIARVCSRETNITEARIIAYKIFKKI